MTDGVIRIGLRGSIENEGIAQCDYPLVSSTGRYLLPTKTIISGGGGQFQLNSLITGVCINCTLRPESFFSSPADNLGLYKA